MNILLLGKVKKSSSHYGWKMAVRKQPEITPEAVVYTDTAKSSCVVLMLKQGKLITESVRFKPSGLLARCHTSPQKPSVLPGHAAPCPLGHGLLSPQGEEAPPGAISGCDKYFLGQTEEFL